MTKVEMEFDLPVGFVDEAGKEHKKGTMRPLKGIDILELQRNPKVQALAKENYNLRSGNPVEMMLAGGTMTVLQSFLLARCVTSLGNLPPEKITPELFSEVLYVKDINYLTGIYQRLNGIEGEASGPFDFATSAN